MSLIESIASIGLLLLVLGEGVAFISLEISLVRGISNRVDKERALQEVINEQLASERCKVEDLSLRCSSDGRERIYYLP